MKQAPRILVLNGPNLNLLGVREPDIYGSQTLADVGKRCRDVAKTLGLAVDCKQSNCEGELVEWIQKSRKTHSGIVINAAAYSHTSVAIMDALKLSDLPIIEVHISNVHAREEFRHYSYVSAIADGVICGLGIEGYEYAIQHLSKLIKSPNRK
ncbi:MAG: type II 3-dehydroquinate dehydratase [Alphaproteobacteria bacterium]|nr:type II 3-dehydroquinate dehydratase [Alphaproteobacteria bacterium]